MMHCFAGQQQLYDCVTSHLVTTCPNPAIPAAVWGMKTAPLGLPSGVPAGWSVGVCRMKAHARILCAWPEFLLSYL